MANFLLIHGSWHGAWCWHKITPRLEAEGCRVIVPDLPGRGRNPGTPRRIGLNRMLGVLASCLPPEGKVNVVVHSRYGILASALAERFPDRIAQTTYLASFMLPGGRSAAEYFRWDKGSYLRPHMAVSRTGMWDWLQPEAYREGLYHDCSDDDIALANVMLCREPLRPALAKMKLSDDRYGQVRRNDIRLTEDRAVTVALQDRLLNETGADRVESIKASHSAYFSRPDELARTILKLSRP